MTARYRPMIDHQIPQDLLRDPIVGQCGDDTAPCSRITPARQPVALSRAMPGRREAWVVRQGLRLTDRHGGATIARAERHAVENSPNPETLSLRLSSATSLEWRPT